MPSVCLYFQVHQPYRLRPFSFFEAGKSLDYFDSKLNSEIISRVAKRCYQPTGESFLRAIRKHPGRFNLSFSISGTAIEQMRAWTPKALDTFRDLTATGQVELLAETYYHSLVSLTEDKAEFHKQVRDHIDLMASEFGVVPRVFRNTELIHSDSIADSISELGLHGVFVEGIPEMLGARSPHAVYRNHGDTLSLLPRDAELSDLLGFKLRNGGPNNSALKPEDFVRRIKEIAKSDETIFVALDFETFGEHHQGDFGIVNFIELAADLLLSDSDWSFVTPSQAIARASSRDVLSFPTVRSWADVARDITPWQGNAMQKAALKRLYSDEFRSLCDENLWRYLQTSDHFYYMSNKGGPDGEVHSYFRPYESPYDAFICYMNVLQGASSVERTQKPRSLL
jgi:alpha-amylase